MHPFPLAGAIGLAIFLGVRFRRLGRATLLLGLLVAAGLALWGFGVVEPPNLTQLIEDVGQRLGKWTYLLVGTLAYLETGAFVGLIAPGESAVLVGGVVAGQGEISIVALIALVWTCAVLGDVTSYTLGRRLGRGFLERHGPKLKITEERLQHVEGFFDRHGGATILIGRFIGLVRALAPFVAGASRMELRRFLPYDIVGAGLWSALFCLLGYFFWQSLATVEKYIGVGAAAFAGLVAIGLVIAFALRLRRDPELRARVRGRLEASPAWRRVHGLPGRLSLELTTLLAIASVGLYTYFWLASLLDSSQIARLDDDAFRIADALATAMVIDVVSVLTHIGSLPVTLLAVLLTAGWAIRTRRATREGVALIAAYALIFAAVHIGKAATDRPRPSDPRAGAEGFSYPSGHAAYAVALVACAIVLARGGHGLAARSALVGIAIVVAVGVAASRVYLRVHYLSDVIGGLAVGTAIFSLAGIVVLAVGTLRHNEGR
jgi:membrane protein DedA with SNARE-associated domain/membrane-associated phospholipid phosphatase